jgi:hypothetical protein
MLCRRLIARRTDILIRLDRSGTSNPSLLLPQGVRFDQDRQRHPCLLIAVGSDFLNQKLTIGEKVSIYGFVDICLLSFGYRASSTAP